MILVLDPLTDRLYYVIVCNASIRIEARDGSITENIPNPCPRWKDSIRHGADWLEKRLGNMVIGENWRADKYAEWQSSK